MEHVFITERHNGKAAVKMHLLEAVVATHEPINFDIYGHQVRYVPERTCKNTDEDGDAWFTCSKCGETTSTEWFCAGYGRGNYCPNCGAKVRKVVP